MTTPLLVGEASHVAEKKLGRHRRRSAGPQTWTTSTSQPTSSLRGAGDARSMTPMPDRPATATSAASDAFSAQRLPRDSVVAPTPAPPLGAVIAGATAERVKRGSLKGDWLATQIPSYAHMSELLTCSDAPAIVPVDERRAMTHAELRELVYRADADLRSWGVRTPGSRVGVAVPNGPELMSVLMCVMDRHTAVPVNPATTPQEMQAELRATGVVALVYHGGSETAPEMQKLCRELGIAPLAITPDAHVGGALSLPCVAGDTVWTIDRWSPNDDDERDDEHDIVSVVLTKASRYLSSPAWSKLFADDAEEKSLTQLARELAEADEPSPRHCDLPEAAQIALEDTRERRLMMGAGRWTPDDPAFDDFRVVLSNEGEEK